MSKNKVERSIYYYDMQCYVHNEEGKVKRCDNTNSIIEELFKDVFEEQNNNDSDIMIDTTDGNKLFIIIDSYEEKIIKFRLVLCRKDALPFLEKDGKLESLSEYIDDDQSIAEITHCIYFRKCGIFGVEYNFSGARASSIAAYITEKCETIIYTRCQPKLNLEAYKKINKNRDFTLFDLSIKNNSSLYNKLLKDKSVFLACNDELDDVGTFEIVLKKRRTKRNGFKGFNLPFDVEQIEKMLKENIEDIKTLKVSQDSFNEAIDLLSDKFVQHTTVVRTEKRTIDAEQMYKKINSFFITNVAQYCNDN